MYFIFDKYKDFIIKARLLVVSTHSLIFIECMCIIKHQKQQKRECGKLNRALELLFL